MQKLKHIYDNYISSALLALIIVCGLVLLIIQVDKYGREQHQHRERLRGEILMLQWENEKLNDIYYWRIEQIDKLRAENEELRELVGDVPEWRGREYYLSE